MPRTQLPRPEALSEISDAFDALVRIECYELSAPVVAERIPVVVASQQGAIDRLQALAPKLEPESEEARLVAPVLTYVDAERARCARYADMPLGDALAAAVLSYEPPDAAERRKFEHSAWEGLGRLKEKARNAKLRSDSVRKFAAERETPGSVAPERKPVQFNRRLIAALAEIALPPRRGTITALGHLKDNYPDLWKAVKPRITSSWWRTQMAASQKNRAAKMASNAKTLQAPRSKLGG